MWTFAGGQARLCSLEWQKTTLFGKGTTFHRVEFQSGGKKPVEIAGKTEGDAPLASLSPDRKLAVVSVKGKLLVIDAAGETVAAVDPAGGDR
jgi:hypothetical protein